MKNVIVAATIASLAVFQSGCGGCGGLPAKVFDQKYCHSKEPEANKNAKKIETCVKLDKSEKITMSIKDGDAAATDSSSEGCKCEADKEDKKKFKCTWSTALKSTHVTDDEGVKEATYEVSGDEFKMKAKEAELTFKAEKKEDKKDEKKKFFF